MEMLLDDNIINELLMKHKNIKFWNKNQFKNSQLIR